jgi:hypothetical protein
VEKENGWIRKAFGINGLNLKSELTGIIGLRKPMNYLWKIK